MITHPAVCVAEILHYKIIAFIKNPNRRVGAPKEIPSDLADGHFRDRPGNRTKPCRQMISLSLILSNRPQFKPLVQTPDFPVGKETAEEDKTFLKAKTWRRYGSATARLGSESR